MFALPISALSTRAFSTLRSALPQRTTTWSVSSRLIAFGSRAEIEVTRVEVHLFGMVPWEFAEAEGEGFASIEHWREAHREFYAKEGIDVTDDDLVVCVWFRVARVFESR